MKVFDLLEDTYLYLYRVSSNVHYVLGEICHPMMIINVEVSEKFENDLGKLYK